MSKTLSIFLDLLRFSAAMVVVAEHITEGLFASGPWEHLALCAVAVFFVLSGYVISYVVSRKENHALDYTAARISRLYSVLVPAIVLSGLVQWICLHLDARSLDAWYAPGANLYFLHRFPLLRFLAQSVASLTFLNSIHNHDVYPAMDSPVWSLSFEAAYYALFGAALFSKAIVRIVVLVLCCLLFGTSILRLLPVWLAGVALHRLTQRGWTQGRVAGIIGGISLAATGAGLAWWPSFYAWANAPHAPWLSLMLQGGGRASFAYLFYYWGGLTSLLILAAAALEDGLKYVLMPLERPIRWCAGHTFSLYLFHFPLFVLVYVVTRYDRTSMLARGSALLAVVFMCFALSTISESKKVWWRDRVHAALARFFHQSRRLRVSP